jgi:ribonuclease P protein component
VAAGRSDAIAETPLQADGAPITDTAPRDRSERQSTPRRRRSPLDLHFLFASKRQFGSRKPIEKRRRPGAGVDLPDGLSYMTRLCPRGEAARGVGFREAHLPAEPARPQAPAWLSRTNGDGRREAGAGAQACEGAQTSLGLNTSVVRARSPVASGGTLVGLKRRAEFLRVAAAGGKAATPGLVLQAAPRHERAQGDGQIRIGVTASRKVGGAVVRNRSKRRLRALAREVLPRAGRPATDYVLVARAATAERPFAMLVADLERALRRVHRTLPAKRRVAAEEN